MSCETASAPSVQPAITPTGSRFSCPHLAAEPVTRDEVEKVFSGIPAVVLGQFWTEDKNFRPGRARIAHTDEALLVWTDFEDADVFNPVTEFNQPAYQHGDVSEVFWLPEGSDRYAEIHVTPEGAIWQAVFPVGWMEERRNAEKKNGKPAESQLDDLMLWSPRPRVMNWLTSGGWATFIAIPYTLFGTAPSSGKIAICRYDYTRGEAKPALSSTAAFARCDFHLYEYWNALDLQPA